MIAISTFVQQTPQWYDARLGIPTASKFAAVMSKGRGKQPSKTRMSYMYELAAERITGRTHYVFQTAAMLRGIQAEPVLRDKYATLHQPVQEVGFVLNHDLRAGASPDGLVEEGLLEIKTMAPHLMIAGLAESDLPARWWPQIQGQMLISDRAWCDLVVWADDVGMWVERVARDSDYSEQLAVALELFVDELDEVTEQVLDKLYKEEPF